MVGLPLAYAIDKACGGPSWRGSVGAVDPAWRCCADLARTASPGAAARRSVPRAETAVRIGLLSFHIGYFVVF